MAVNVRVEARRLPHNVSKEDRNKALNNLLKVFKRACDDAGLNDEMKERKNFVRKTDIRRRKKQMRRLIASGKIRVRNEEWNADWSR